MSVYASKIVKNMYGSEEIREIFSDERKIEYFVKIEVALAKVEAELGIIPVEAYDEIMMRAPEFKIDWEKLRIDVETVGYPVLPFLKQFSAFCGESGQYLHWGSTTRDITDTCVVLQMRDALELIRCDLNRVQQALFSLTREHASVIMIARTHGMHALPTTVGFRFAIWLSEIHRQVKRLKNVCREFNTGQFGGAVGTLAALGNRGLEVQTNLMRELGLEAPTISWFASRDRVSEVVFTLAMIAQSMASIAKTLVVMSRDEVQEAREGSPTGRGTSSAMPHKRNTVGSELILVHGRMVTSFLPTVMEAMVQDYDRDWQGHFENILVPQSFLHTHAAIKEMFTILENLELYPDNMQRNLDITKGQIMAECVMMHLATRMGREKAHKHVSNLCGQAIHSDQHLSELLNADATVRKYLSTSEIDELMNPKNYLGSTNAIIENILKEVAEDL